MNICIASMPTREDMLRKTVLSLQSQGDIYVALNGYDHIPEFLSPQKVVLLDNSKGDAGKFWWADKLEGYFFTCDDDLIYPENYVQYMISGVVKYNCPCTLHGKVYPRPIVSFGSPALTQRCLNDVTGDGRVDVGGTGVMAWHSDMLKISFDDFGSKNMADLWFAKACHEQGVKIMCLAHNKGNLIYQGPNETIWEEEKGKGFIEQTKLLKSFLK